MSTVEKLRSDFRGMIFKALRRNRLRLLRIFSTRIGNLLLWLKGISIGENSTFFGLAYFYREPLSQISIGSNCRFRSDTTSNFAGVNRRCMISTVRPGAKITIGNDVAMSGTVIGAAKQITIEDGVLCGANVLITDWDWHPIAALQRHESGGDAKAVRIGRNAWIGINSVILKGVNIGENTIIGANSLVTHDIPANVIAGGSPCKVIKELIQLQEG